MWEALKNQLLSSPKEKLLGLSTTAHLHNPPVFVSAVRETDRTISGNFVFSDSARIEEVVTYFDGSVDYFLVDCETKNAACENLPSLAREKIKKSKIYYYKPNDYTVDSLDILLSCLVPTLAKKKVAVVGAGNIGSKIAVKLSERGAHITLWKRNFAEAEQIASGLNLFANHQETITASQSIETAIQGAHIVLVCTPGVPTLTVSHIDTLNQDTYILDVGNGTLEESAIKRANERNLKIYCLYPKGGYDGFITNWLFTREYVKNLGREKVADSLFHLSAGLVGSYGDILVDNPKHVTKVFGVCNGKGDLLPPPQAQSFLERYHAHGAQD